MSEAEAGAKPNKARSAGGGRVQRYYATHYPNKYKQMKIKLWQSPMNSFLQPLELESFVTFTFGHTALFRTFVFATTF